MKSDRLQGIILPKPYGNKTEKSKPQRLRVLSSNFIRRKVRGFGDRNSKAETRYIEVREDYAELIASDLFERLRNNKPAHK